MKNLFFGYQNELERHTQQQLARDASRADALVAVVCGVGLAVIVVLQFAGVLK